MNPVDETRLLLVVVLAGTVLSTMAWNWPEPWAALVAFGGALVAGMSASRINRIVFKATA